MLDDLNQQDRMRLMRFICSFVWADLEVSDAERKFVSRVMRKLHLDATERAQISAWLEIPPDPEEVDPTEIPAEHRRLFLDVVEKLVAADHTLKEGELGNLYLFRQLIG